MATRTEVNALISLMEETLAHRNKLSAGAVAMYHKILADIPFEVLEAAATDIIATEEWVPVPAIWRARALSYTMPELPSNIEAWAEVMDQVKRVGYMGKPEFKTVAVSRTVESFGWRNICLNENLDMLRAHFLKAYEQIAGRESRERVLLPEIKQLEKQLSSGKE